MSYQVRNDQIFRSTTEEYQQFVGLSGLPRSGSTLLSAILSQNPLIHAEGNSAVCQFMWDIYVSYRDNCLQQLKANNKEGILLDLLSMVPNVYYKKRPASETIIVDKCRSWTRESNFQMIQACIGPTVKVIVLERPIKDVVNSFARLYHSNGIKGEALETELLALLEPDNETIMRSFDGIQWAKANNSSNNFLFVNYDDLVADPGAILAKIYEHCEWAPFEHDFDNVLNKYPENDDVYGVVNHHEIRQKVGKIRRDYSLLSEAVINACNSVDNTIIKHRRS